MKSYSLLKNSAFTAKALLLAAILGLSACSSPEEKANKYYEKAMELFKQGELDKAKIEFRNALQIKGNMTDALYKLAQIAEVKGNWQEMFNFLSKVVDIDPKHLDAQVKLGRMLLAAGQLDRALAASDATMALDKDSSMVLAFRATVLYRLDDKKGAVEQANAALVKDPNNVDALVVLATERLQEGDADKAIEYLDRGLKLNEKNVALQLFKVQALEKVAKSAEAETIFRKLINFYPKSRAIRHALARFYLVHRAPEKAEAEYRSIIAENPVDPKAKLDLVNFIAQLRGGKAAVDELKAFVQQEPENLELQFALASFYQAQKDIKSADEVLRSVVAKVGDTPDGLKAKGALATSSLRAGDIAGANKLIAEILTKDPRNEQAVTLKAGLDLDEGKIDETIANLRALLRDVPNSAQALLLLGKAHELGGSPELAEEHYMKAFQANKSEAAFGVAFAEYLIKRGDAERAEAILEEALSRIPGHLPALKMLAQARVSQGDWAGAQAVADEVRRQGDEGKISEQISGAIHAGKREYEASIASFRKYYEASPNDMQPVVALVQAYLLAGKTNEALTFITSVLQANPGNTAARLLQAQLQEKKGDLVAAALSYQTVMGNAPKNPGGYNGLASLRMRETRYSEADQVISQGLAALPNNFGLRMTRATLYELSGRVDDAIPLYEALLKEQPKSDVLANNLASLLSDYRTDKASLDRAYELAQRVRRSEIPQFVDTAGWASYKVGKLDEAITLLKSAVKSRPDVAVFRYHLGMAYLGKADKSGARQELEKAVQLASKQPFPQLGEVKKVLQGL